MQISRLKIRQRNPAIITAEVISVTRCARSQRGRRVAFSRTLHKTPSYRVTSIRVKIDVKKKKKERRGKKRNNCVASVLKSFHGGTIHRGIKQNSRESLVAQFPTPPSAQPTPSSYVAAFLLRTIPLTFINVSKSRKYNLARLVVGSADATIHPSGLPFFFSLSFSLSHTFLFLVLSLSIFLYLPLSFVVSILEIEILPRWKKATSKRFGGTPALDFPDYVRVNVILRRYQQLERTWRG